MLNKINQIKKYLAKKFPLVKGKVAGYRIIFGILKDFMKFGEIILDKGDFDYILK